QLATELRRPDGLLKMLELLKSRLADVGSVQRSSDLAAIFGGGRTMQGMLTLFNQLDRLKSKYGDVTKGANTFNSAWQSFSHTAAATAQRAKATLEAALVS